MSIFKAFFKSQKYSFCDLKEVYQTIFFVPKIIIIVFRGKGLLNKFVICLPLIEKVDFFNMKTETMVEFMRKKISQTDANVGSPPPH